MQLVMMILLARLCLFLGLDLNWIFDPIHRWRQQAEQTERLERRREAVRNRRLS